VEPKAWGGASPYRLQTIFDTNLQLAYGAGRYQAATELKTDRPYCQGRASPNCQGRASPTGASR